MRRALLAILGVALGIACLWLSTRSVNWPEAVRIFRNADSRLLATGVALFGVDIILRALRWRTILAFRTPVTAGMSLQALMAGYAVNSVLPARLGEVFRAHYLGRRAHVSRSSVMASIVIERLLDLMAVVLSLAAGLVLAGGGDGASRHVLVGGAAVAIAAVLFLVCVAWLLSRRSGEEWLLVVLARLPGGATIARRLGSMLGEFTQTLQLVRTRHFFFALLFTVPIWALELGAMWHVCQAVGVSPGLAGMLTLMGGASLSTLMPTAPGYVGSYQIAFVIILGQFGVTSTSAIVASTAIQIYLIGTYTLAGLAILALTSALSARPSA